jgi:transcriptional regulator with XRE-family HTH domain
MSDITKTLIREMRRRAGLSQGELASRAGTSQPAIARLERGLSSPNLATLDRLANVAGFRLRIELVPSAPIDPLVEAYKRDVDRTLLRENLRRSVDDRLLSLSDMQDFGRELQRSVRTRARKAKP